MSENQSNHREAMMSGPIGAEYEEGPGNVDRGEPKLSPEAQGILKALCMHLDEIAARKAVYIADKLGTGFELVTETTVISGLAGGVRNDELPKLVSDRLPKVFAHLKATLPQESRTFHTVRDGSFEAVAWVERRIPASLLQTKLPYIILMFGTPARIHHSAVSTYYRGPRELVEIFERDIVERFKEMLDETANKQKPNGVDGRTAEGCGKI